MFASVVRALAAGTRRTTYQSLIVRGGLPHCSSESKPSVSHWLPRRDATIFNKTLPSWATSEISVQLLQSVRSFFFVKGLDVRIFLLLGEFSCYPTIGKDVVVKALEARGVVDFQEFGRETSWPNSFPIRQPLKCASVISSTDGSSPSDSLCRRGGKKCTALIPIMCHPHTKGLPESKGSKHGGQCSSQQADPNV